MKCSLCNSWRENSLRKSLQPFTKLPINLSLSSDTSEKNYLRRLCGERDHEEVRLSVGGNGSILIRASLQCTWLTVRHTAGLNGHHNISHRYVMVYAHKSLRLADSLQGRMERVACNAFRYRRQPWRVQLQSHPIWRLLWAFDAYLFKGLRSCPVYAARFI